MAALYGCIEAFDISSGSWDSYIERVEMFFEANSVVEGKKVPTLLSILGPDAYNLAKTLSSPAKPSEKSFDELKLLLNEHFCHRPLVIAERYRFHNARQTDTESTLLFVARLKKLAEHCQFEGHLKEMLRDRFVCGIRNQKITQRLLSEADLTFEKAVRVSQAMEAADKGSKELCNITPQGTVNVHKVEVSKSQASKPCHRCRGNHSPDVCWYKKTECHNCGKVGHIQSACMAKGSKETKKKSQGQSKYYSKGKKGYNKGRSQNTHNVEDAQEGSSVTSPRNDEYQDIYQVEEVLSCTGAAPGPVPKPIMLSVLLDGKPLQMELDTGATRSLMSQRDFKRLFPGKQLEKSNLLMRTYTYEVFEPLGFIKVKAQYQSQVQDVVIYVVSQGGSALFGREWLRCFKLDWNEIAAVKKIETTTKSAEEALKQVLVKYPDVFKPTLGCVKGAQIKLHMKADSKPVYHKARPVPYALKPRIEEELSRLEKLGIIEKVSSSDWASPTVNVVKADGVSIRVCGDFKVSINSQLEDEVYPIPVIQEVFAKMGSFASPETRYSKIDLREAYAQLVVDPESRPYLTINTHQGLYRYTRVCYGIKTALAIFQRTMDQLLGDIKGVQCFMDDILITAKNDVSHIEAIEKVLKKLQEVGFTVKKEKCEFFKKTVQYLGHRIDAEGLHMTKEKVHAILQAPAPKDVGQLKSFLGMIHYYGKFCPNLSQTLAPMTELLHQDQEWVWSSKCGEAFDAAKKSIASDRVLTHYDPSLPVRLASDASSYGIGAVLSHVLPEGEERPIAFASRTLSSAERGYSQLDKEALGLVYGVKKFHQFLYGRKFTLVTDHKPLTSIFHPNKGIPSLAAARLQRWAIILAAYDYEIEFRGTREHANADGLSRLPLDNTATDKVDPVFMFQEAQFDRLPVTSEMIRKETRKDPVLSLVYDYTQRGWPSPSDQQLKAYHQRRNELTVHQGCLLWGMRVIIPQKFREEIKEELHAGHVGMAKMKSLARSYVWWPDLDKHLEQTARECQSCQLIQKDPSLAPLHPWMYPEQPWERLHIDFAGPFMGHMFMIVVDAHSKWPEVVIMDSTTTTKTIDVLRGLFSRYGLPSQIVSDNGPQLVSDDFEQFLKRNGVQHIKSAPYHPSTNGLAERFVQTMKQGMKAAKYEHLTVKQKLNNFLLAYRRSPHSTTGDSPANLFLKRSIRTRLDLIKPNIHKQVKQQQFKQVESRVNGKDRQLLIGQKVLARNYRGGDKWVPGIILSQTGPLSYTVKTNTGIPWRRHIDQLLDLSRDHTPMPMPLIEEDINIPVLLPQQNGTNYQPQVETPVDVHMEDKEVPESPPTAIPMITPLRRSDRARAPPKRLINEM